MRQAWLVGAVSFVVGAGLVVTWSSGQPRLETSVAQAAPRHRVVELHAQAATPLVVAPEPAPEAVPPVPAPRLARAPRPPASSDPDKVTIELPDLPEPPPQVPLMLDDLYPVVAHAAPGAPGAALRPCFDQLQGVKGLSPCPDSTPRP
jgi:hypothetical protein